MLRPACPGPAAPRSRSARRRRRLRRERSRAQPGRPAPSTPRRGGERGRGRVPGFPRTKPAAERTPASLPRVPGGQANPGAPSPHHPRLSFPAGGEPGPRATARLPRRRLHAARGSGPRPSARPRPACQHPKLGRRTARGAPRARTARAPSSRSPGSRSAVPYRTPAGESAFGTLPQERAKEKEKFARPRPGSPRAGRRRASRWLLAGAPCLSAGLPAPCPARPPLPQPRPGRRRRLSRPSDDAAARLPALPPRCECRPARARGAHTLPLAGAHSHTHARPRRLRRRRRRRRHSRKEWGAEGSAGAGGGAAGRGAGQ